MPKRRTNHIVNKGQECSKGRFGFSGRLHTGRPENAGPVARLYCILSKVWFLDIPQLGGRVPPEFPPSPYPAGYISLPFALIQMVLASTPAWIQNLGAHNSVFSNTNLMFKKLIGRIFGLMCFINESYNFLWIRTFGTASLLIAWEPSVPLKCIPVVLIYIVSNFWCYQQSNPEILMLHDELAVAKRDCIHIPNKLINKPPVELYIIFDGVGY